MRAKQQAQQQQQEQAGVSARGPGMGTHSPVPYLKYQWSELGTGVFIEDLQVAVF